MNALFDFNIEIGGADRRMHGVASAVVLNNIDITGQGRVQVRLPWLPGVDPWARVAAMGGGSLAGVWWQPQIDEEVIVGFLHGEVSSPVILGSVWSALDQPPVDLPTDAVTKRVMKTPYGATVTLDDLLQSVTIETPLGQKIDMSPTGITIDAGKGVGASITMDAAGRIQIESGLEITLKSKSITLDAAKVSISGTASASLSSNGSTKISGSMVEIN